MRVICLWHRLVRFQCCQVMHVQLDSRGCACLPTSLARLQAFEFCLFKGDFIDRQSSLLGHDLGQVYREAIRIV